MLTCVLLFRLGDVKPVLEHGQGGSCLWLGGTYGYTETNGLFGGSGDLDSCSPWRPAEFPTEASAAGDLWFFGLWAESKTVLSLGDPVPVFVTLPARKQLLRPTAVFTYIP